MSLARSPDDRQRRVAEKARLAAGGLRLAGLGMRGVGLDRKRLERAQGIGPALRRDRLIDQVARRLRLRRRRLADRQQQRRGSPQQVFHCDSSHTFLTAAARSSS